MRLVWLSKVSVRAYPQFRSNVRRKFPPMFRAVRLAAFFQSRYATPRYAARLSAMVGRVDYRAEFRSNVRRKFGARAHSAGWTLARRGDRFTGGVA